MKDGYNKIRIACHMQDCVHHIVKKYCELEYSTCKLSLIIITYENQCIDYKKEKDVKINEY